MEFALWITLSANWYSEHPLSRSFPPSISTTIWWPYAAQILSSSFNSSQTSHPVTQPSPGRRRQSSLSNRGTLPRNVIPQLGMPSASALLHVTHLQIWQRVHKFIVNCLPALFTVSKLICLVVLCFRNGWKCWRLKLLSYFDPLHLLVMRCMPRVCSWCDIRSALSLPVLGSGYSHRPYSGHICQQIIRIR